MFGLKSKNVAVVGIGNVLLSDEGVGVHVLNKLKDSYLFPENVELIDAGTIGLDLLPFIEGKERVLFIDAVNFKSKPGTIGELNNGEIPEYFSSNKLSVHQISLPDTLAAGRLLGTIPEVMSLIGIQPDNIDTGYGLSPKIQDKFEFLILKVLDKLSEWGVNVKLKVNN